MTTLLSVPRLIPRQVRYAELVGKQESSRRKGSGKGKDKDCIIA